MEYIYIYIFKLIPSCEIRSQRDDINQSESIFYLIAFSSRNLSSDDENIAWPIPWMAPETLSKKPKFTTKSDVYAFGILIYEVIVFYFYLLNYYRQENETYL